MKSNTEKSFRDKWEMNSKSFLKDVLLEGSNTQNWILNRNGFRNLSEFKKFLSNKKRILDAGCGNGRVTALLCECSSFESQLMGVDLVSSEVASENLKEIDNVTFKEANLVEDLSGLGLFDFIYCQEVLHHTIDPFRAFGNLCKLLLDGGEIAIYVYKKKSPVREFVDDLIRDKVSDLDYSAAYKVSAAITELGEVLSEIDTKINVAPIPELEIEGGEYSVQRFFYHFFMKCYWNPELSREENIIVNYDWYHPEISSKHTVDEVKSWFKDLGLEIIYENVDFYGITIRGKKI
jgi:SAM-dependent methyltransferase